MSRGIAGSLLLSLVCVLAIAAYDPDVNPSDFAGWRNAVMDDSTQALMTVDYAHHEIHSGNHYACRRVHELTKAGYVDHLIVTPDTAAYSHTIIGIETTTSSVMAVLYEGASANTLGDAVAIINRNRNSSNTASTAIYESPALGTIGTTLFTSDFGAGRSSGGGGDRDLNEIVLKRNTQYLLRVTEDDIQATDVNVLVDWYEHTDK